MGEDGAGGEEGRGWMIERILGGVGLLFSIAEESDELVSEMEEASGSARGEEGRGGSGLSERAGSSSLLSCSASPSSSSSYPPTTGSLSFSLLSNWRTDAISMEGFA